MKKNNTPKTYEELETIAQQLLDVMNNKNFHSSVVNAAQKQLNGICYDMWQINEELKFVTWMYDNKDVCVLTYVWNKKNEKENN